MTDQRPETTAQLRRDINARKPSATNAVGEVAASPLGTDDEAAGAPADGDRVAMARRAEAKIAATAQGRRKPD